MILLLTFTKNDKKFKWKKKNTQRYSPHGDSSHYRDRKRGRNTSEGRAERKDSWKGMKIFIWRLRADSRLRKDSAPRKDALISAYDGYVSQSETPTRPHSAPSTPIVRLIYVFSRVIRSPIPLRSPRRRGSVAMAMPGVPAPNRRAPTPSRRRPCEDEKDDNNWWGKQGATPGVVRGRTDRSAVSRWSGGVKSTIEKRRVSPAATRKFIAG